MNMNNSSAVAELPQDQQPLLRALISEAAHRGDTLAKLARELGVTYERLAQWRRGEGSIATARRSVHEQAANYLRFPVALVLVMAGQIRPADFVWPARPPLRERISSEIEKLKQHPHVGAFVPPELTTAAESVKLFVLFVCHELEGRGPLDRDGHRWLAALHRAALDPVARASVPAGQQNASAPLF